MQRLVTHKLRRLATGIIVTVMAAVGFTPLAHATYPARNGLIAFSAQVNGTAQIFTVRPNGQDLQQITHTAYDAADADWSPDGHRIAFTMGIGNDCSAIALMNADGSNLVTLPPATNSCEDQPSFTPDGQRIVFERFTFDPCCEDAIWSMDLTGGDQHSITDGTGLGVTDPNVSPDGKTVSFVDYNGQNFGQALDTVGIDGSNLHQLTPFTFDVGIKQDWAPDGRHLVFTENADFPQLTDSANVVTVRPDGTDLRSLTNYTGGQVNAFVGSYSPDGHWLVFRLEDHGRYGLYRMAAEGGPLQVIIPLSSFRPRYIDWGPAPER